MSTKTVSDREDPVIETRDQLIAAIAKGEKPKDRWRIGTEHEKFVRSHQVWGTPTFIVEDKAVFVRLLDHAHGNQSVGKATIERILDDIDWPILNELKHTSIPM